MAQQILSVKGIDLKNEPGFEVPKRPSLELMDPVAASDMIADEMYVRNDQRGSSLSLQGRAQDSQEQISHERGNLRPMEYQKVLEKTDALVRRKLAKAMQEGYPMSYAQALADVRPSRDVQQILLARNSRGLPIGVRP